jgi:hypothetical protein
VCLPYPVMQPSAWSRDHLRKIRSNMVILKLRCVCCTQSYNPSCSLEIIWGFKMSKLLNLIGYSLDCLLTCINWSLSCICERLAKHVSQIIVAHLEMISILFIYACLAWDWSPYVCGLLMVYLWGLTLIFAKSWHLVEHSCFKYLLV